MAVSKKIYGWALTQGFALIMVGILIVSPSSWQTLTFYSGYLAVGFLLLVLSLNPLKSLFPQILFLKKINQYRREIGVASFTCAWVHLLCFIIKRGSMEAMVPFLLHPALVSVFWVALPILFLLAITSNNGAVKKLGYLRWKKIHQKVYLAEAAVFLHMILVGQKVYAFLLFTPLFIIQWVSKRMRNKRTVSTDTL